MIRLALVEDDAGYRQLLRGYLDRYIEETGTRLEVVEFSDGDEIALHYKADYDLILMDIELTFMDGMTAAEEIRKLDSQVIIIFITNSPQYAIKGYQVDAMDYMLKPVSYFAFSQRLAKAIRQINLQKVPDYIKIAVKNGMRRLDLADLLYVESQRHTLCYHTSEEILEGTGTLKDLEKQMKGRFFPCAKGFLVNLDKVDGIVGDEILVGTVRLPLSRTRKKEFLETLNRFSLERGTR